MDYRISLRQRKEAIDLKQGEDGLWRCGSDQAVLQIAADGVSLPPGAERLELMGERKVGNVEVLETNPVRVRLVNTWYFPTRPGEWVSLAVRQIRWEYTFYFDGRWVTRAEINNSGGTQIGTLRMWLRDDAGWSHGAVSRDLVIRQFTGPIGRWSFMVPPAGLQRTMLRANYMNPGTIKAGIAARGVFAPGDLNRDGFDESQGCYF
ncbi:MAG: hypothetical protein ACYSTL_00480, partial [Planctomycetota bacterium]